jgi:FMN reductase
MAHPPFIVGIGGTPRADSTTERCLRLALNRAQALGCRTQLIGGPDLPREIYDAGQSARSPQALQLIEAIREADGVVLATPSYHGSISGLLKNALDYIEDLRGDRRVYLQDRAVGVIVCAEGPQALGSTLAAVRSVVHALRGWPTPLGAAVNTALRPFDADGAVTDEAVRRSCEAVAEEVVVFAQRWHAAI